ncbi:MAG TPA: ComF family protein [Bacteroidetes bacterium]|nr:ComF family protein [Bacteroidota bacterium]
MRKQTIELINNFTSLFFPHLCLACGIEAPPLGADICTTCEATLPLSHYHQSKENPFTERFWGRLLIHTGAAMYLYARQSRVARLIHNLKYKGRKEVGLLLGERYGHSLKREPHFQEADCIVPVPLHWKKQLIRGFNQSEMFGNGLSESLAIPCIADGLERLAHTSSQTKKSRHERLSNMEGVFAVKKPQHLKGRHILLVDDVLTTGATLEMCANELLRLPDTTISMATIAIAIH